MVNNTLNENRFFLIGNYRLHWIKGDKADTLLMVHLKWAK